MRVYRYSATQWIYGRESLARSLDSLKKHGYDGIELAGEPRATDVEEVKRLLHERDMTCTSICGIYSAERDLIRRLSCRSAGIVRLIERRMHKAWN